MRARVYEPATASIDIAVTVYRGSVKFPMKARACCVRERSKLEVAADGGRDVRAGEKVPGASTGKVLARDGRESMSKQSCQTGSVKPSFRR